MNPEFSLSRANTQNSDLKLPQTSSKLLTKGVY